MAGGQDAPGSGIGRATALRLAADGYRVTLAGRRAAMLDETAKLITGPTPLTSICDVTDAAAVQVTVADTVREFGRIDLVVNNAGISRTAPIREVTMQQWRDVMAVDVESIILLTRAALPFLLHSSGSIVNVASVVGQGGAMPFEHEGVVPVARVVAADPTGSSAGEPVPLDPVGPNRS